LSKLGTDTITDFFYMYKKKMAMNKLKIYVHFITI